jgi:uncharacterized protein (DUF427 family)
MGVTIKENASGAVLAEAGDVLTYEGNLYFDPSAVRTDVLSVTERTYTCPYKGTCHWVDYAGPDGIRARDVAWVYADPKPGHEAIRGRYGFYATSRGATRREG